MKKILAVEDNENNLYLIAYILEKNGFEAINARDGKTGIQKAVEDKPDLIIMDEIKKYLLAGVKNENFSR